MKDIFCTTFCHKSHRIKDGKPIGHECFIMPTEALCLERDGKLAEALKVLANWKKRKPHKGLKANGE